MNTHFESSNPGSDLTRIERSVRLALPLLLAAMTLLLSGCFQASSDTRALRSSALDSSSVDWDRQFEMGVGPVTVGLARFALSFIDLEPEARQAISSVRGADVSIYKARTGASPDYSKVLSAADRSMTRRGWSRILAVTSDQELVAAYIPANLSSPRDMKVNVLVMNKHDLVIAQARSNVEPLLALAFNEIGKNGSVADAILKKDFQVSAK